MKDFLHIAVKVWLVGGVIIFVSARLLFIYVQDVARETVREEIRQLDMRIDALENSVYLEEGESP